MTDTTTDTAVSSSNMSVVPKIVFIVPYRDREPHRVFFSTYIKKVMEDVPPEDWTYFFIHQNDKRPFNRGGMKNIGFLAIKNKYPNNYKSITFVFNDVDTLPYDKNILNYETDFGVVKHFYGFNFALGGIFSIRGSDFEKTNGFPNFWAWGGEDNLIHERAKNRGLLIDRTNFFTIGNMNILQFADGFKRLICRDELATSVMKDNADGIATLKNLNYVIYVDTHMIDVNSFDSLISPYQLKFEEQTLDKVSKIRVSTKSAITNIRELRNKSLLESNGINTSLIPNTNQSTNNTTMNLNQVNQLGGGKMINSSLSYNTINNVIHPSLPFDMNLHNRRPRDFGAFIPQTNAAATVGSLAPSPIVSQYSSTNIYQVNKQPQNMFIPLHRPIGSAPPSIRHQRKIGMRAMFT